MKAAVLSEPQPIASRPLEIRDVADLYVEPGQVLLRVAACGVCRTDLHIVEGELVPRHDGLIPGHQRIDVALCGATVPSRQQVIRAYFRSDLCRW